MLLGSDPTSRSPSCQLANLQYGSSAIMLSFESHELGSDPNGVDATWGQTPIV